MSFSELRGSGVLIVSTVHTIQDERRNSHPTMRRNDILIIHRYYRKMQKIRDFFRKLLINEVIQRISQDIVQRNPLKVLVIRCLDIQSGVFSHLRIFISSLFIINKYILVGTLVVMSLPLLVQASEMTDGPLTQAQIDYIMKQNCDSFTGDTKNFCLQMK